LKSRKSKLIIKYSIYVGIIVAIVTMSVAFLSYRYYNSKLINERSEYEKQLVEEKGKLKIYETKTRMGWVLKNDKKAGEIIKESDVKQTSLPDYFTPLNITSTKEDVVGKVIKINALATTTLTSEMIYDNGVLDASERKEEVEYVKLPLRLKKDDTVDIRIVFPNGEDYIVIPKKKLDDVDINKQNVFYKGNEEEALMLQSALVDAYLNNAELYMKQYVEPEMQEIPIATYTPTIAVIAVIKSDPQIVNKAKWNLIDKVRKGLDERLEAIDPTESIRVGADIPSNSGVSKRKKGDGAVPAATEQQSSEQNSDGSVANPQSKQPNNPIVLEPETSTNQTGKEPIYPSTESNVPSNNVPIKPTATPDLLGGG
jgi:hypothetical protein